MCLATEIAISGAIVFLYNENFLQLIIDEKVSNFTILCRKLLIQYTSTINKRDIYI
jgi:hypothetical protein